MLWARHTSWIFRGSSAIDSINFGCIKRGVGVVEYFEGVGVDLVSFSAYRCFMWCLNAKDKMGIVFENVLFISSAVSISCIS